MATVSLFCLTWNRVELLKKTLPVTLEQAGYAWDELIWVDNGSDAIEHYQMNLLMNGLPITARCFFDHNTGMPRGYNTCMSLCRSDYVVFLGPDMILPQDWLKTFMDYVTKIPETGMASMYNVPIEFMPERYRGSKEIEMKNGLPILKAMPMDICIFKRDLFSKVGYYREDFGLYAWADVEWVLRCERVMNELGILYYVIPGIYNTHFGSEGSGLYKDGFGDSPEYWKWKKEQSDLPSNHALMEKCRQENYQYYSPF